MMLDWPLMVHTSPGDVFAGFVIVAGSVALLALGAWVVVGIVSRIRSWRAPAMPAAAASLDTTDVGEAGKAHKTQRDGESSFHVDAATYMAQRRRR